MNERAGALLWTDAGAGALVGGVVLLLHEWFARLYRLPVSIVVTVALANLLYSTYSGSLAVRASHGRTPSRRAFYTLIGVNALWPVVCASFLICTWSSVSAFGVAHFVLEGLFVGALARIEWKYLR